MKDNTYIEKIKSIINSRTKKTNCFSFYNEICDWIEKNKADFYLVDNSIFAFLKANGFYKFYYWVDSFEDIKLAKTLLDEYRNKSEISLEFTTKNNRFLEEIKEQIYSIGFEFYAEFARLLSSTIRSFKEEKVEYFGQFNLATSIDKNKLLEIMHQEFDKIKDDIPTEDELLELIDKKSILIRKIENEIVYIQIFEYSKNVLYSRMTWIKKEYRKPKYTVEFYNGAIVYVKQLNIPTETQIRSYFWIDTAIKNFKIELKLGATLDGLTSNIFVYKK
ncbi:hypothetical protein N3114_11855 [Aliarcobacter butzleri]|uniref:hypothetical protein n=1 Tax=Aliarcobacter butzleri TaxID=28197 RepID=UPI0021B17952|nr:hypothetical protein [Aliarcobacter butzleri]UXC29332.1 hypothetical protein N3114_11855 [Aliarcobacter butzleri]